mgnify:CR=1 FL=1
MTQTFDYDIVVVGGGPAGSSAAYSAAKRGAKVALIEKEESIAQTVRTSGVTWLDAIKEFEIPKECYNPIKNYGFCSPNNKVMIKDNVSRAAVLDVRKTYRWLAKKAEQIEAEMNEYSDEQYADKREYLKNVLKVIHAVKIKLKQTTFKDHIMREAAEIFYDDNFVRNMDTNKYLLCFNNL